MLKRLRISKFLLLGLALMLGCESLPEMDSDAGGVDRHTCDPKTYALDCMKDEKTVASDGVLEVLGTVKDAVVGATADPVSDARQDAYGEGTREDVFSEFTFLENDPDQTLLEGIMRKLLKQRSHPTEIEYNIYLIDDPQVNAYTLGGEIFVTKSLMVDVHSLDELACIIGHEIGHNELGHIAQIIQDGEAADRLLGPETAAQLDGLIQSVTAGFGQRDEASADLYGIDLALAAGYDACRGIEFEERTAEFEGEANDWDNFGRSHPYGARRAKCERSHLADFHHYSCPD